MNHNKGEIILYESEDGQNAVEVHLKDDTVWLSQAQMVELFQKTKQNVSLHIRNLFREGELVEGAVVKDSLTTAPDGKRYRIKLYNLDVIISVGYRVKSQRGTKFRIWATSILKDHLVQGVTFNQNRLAEQGLGEARQMLTLLANTLESHDLVNNEGREVLNIVISYARTWQLLWQYDEDSLVLPKKEGHVGGMFELDSVKEAIGHLRQDLLRKDEATDIFGHERGDGLAGIIGAIQQTFGGEDLYPSVEEKAAHLLYFTIKDHPFTDGNKRIGSFLFLLFLQTNSQLEQNSFDSRALVALTLLIAASAPDQKDLLIRLVVNLLSEG